MGLAACANGPYDDTTSPQPDASAAPPTDAGADDASTVAPVPDLSHWTTSTDLPRAGLRPPPMRPSGAQPHDAGALDAATAPPDAGEPAAASDPFVDAIRARALPVADAPTDVDPLLALVGDAHYVLLGEESHGSHEFYAAREQVTRRLIAEKGFTAIAVEGNWLDLQALPAAVDKALAYLDAVDTEGDATLP